MHTPDPPARGRRHLFLAGVAVLLLGGFVAVFYLGDSRPPPPPVAPPAPAEEPLPRSPADLLQDLTTATAVGNRPRLVRLLAEDWARFVAWADDEVRAVADARRKAIEAVRHALGEESARLVRDLPDLPDPWPLFAGVDWTRAKVRVPLGTAPLTAEILLDAHAFRAEGRADGGWHLRPADAAALDAMKAEVETALAPLRETYRLVEAQAGDGRLTAETFPAALNAVRSLALATAHPPPKPR